MTRLAWLVFPIAAASLAAQSAVITLLTPAAADAGAGVLAQTVNLAAGPLASSGGAFAACGGPVGLDSRAGVEWDMYVLPYRFGLTMHTVAYVQGAAPDHASFTGGDFLLSLSNPTPVAVQVELTRGPIMGNGLTCSVDVGDDGNVELTATSPSAFVTLQLTLGPVPLSIRIRDNCSLVGPGNLDALLQVAVVPVAGVQGTPAILGCDGGHHLLLQPQFDGDLGFHSIGPLQGTRPCVAVFGLGVQPIVLAPPQPLPCLLLPSPDLVVPLFTGPFVLSVPPAVRPFQFFAQAVVLQPHDLLTTNGYLVDVY